jgi:fused signal recognition particle receptor
MAFDFIRKVFSFGQKPAGAQPAEALREPVPPEAAPSLPPAGFATQAAAPGTPEIPPAPSEAPQPAPLEVPPAPAPSVPAAPPEIPQTPVEVPPAPGQPQPEQAPPEIPVPPAPVAPIPSPEVPAAPAEVPPEPAPSQPGRPSEVPPAPEEPTPPPAAPPEPAPETLPDEPSAHGAAVDMVPLEPEMPAPPSAAPPSALAPSTARQRFGERVSVGKAVGAGAESPREPADAAAPANWLARMRSGLSRSSRELSGNLSGVFTRGKLTEEFVEELEEVLIRSDFGADTATRIAGRLTEGRYGLRTTEREIRDVMAGEIAAILDPVARPLELDLAKTPHVILVVGVNGTGKTTTIGKLAAKLTAGGLSVMLAAGDTFRAAAIEQLKIWGERTGAPVVSSKLGADAAGLAFEAFQRARAEGADVLVIDTAGRLQNKAELMAELEKIVRVLKKLDASAPHTVLQTLDATTGQNALNQVEIFKRQAGVNGLVMTKLDGTARGGILVAIAAKHRLPVFFIGVGEGVDDLEPFSARDFAQTIAGTTYG